MLLYKLRVHAFARAFGCLGMFLVKDNCVFNGPLGRSLSYVRSLAPLTPLIHLRSAPLASLTRHVHGLADSLRSLPRGTVEIPENVFTLWLRFTGTNAFFDRQ